MEITLKDIAEKNGKETFTVSIGGIEIKGCKVAEGKSGPFVSAPGIPPKEDGGKWYNTVFIGHEASATIIKILRGARVPEIDVAKEGFDDDLPPF